MVSLIDNIRLALRDLRHRPLFAATVVLTLAVGIGATTAAFALVDAVFLTQFPVQEQDRVVTMWASANGFPQVGVPWLDTQRLLLERQRAFGAVAGYINASIPFAARDGNRTLHLTAAPVAGSFFDVLGVKPTVGQFFRHEDDAQAAPDVVVLSDILWRREFGADPHVVGRMVFFNGAMYRIVGVAPPAFFYPGTAEAWIPLVPQLYRWGQTSEKGWWVCLVGRLRPGVTERAALTEFDYVLRADSATGKYGAASNQFGFAMSTTGVVERFTDSVLGGEVRPGVLVLFAAAALVLVIGCTNVAALLLARGISRATDLAVRGALGASRRQLLGHVLTESTVLGLTGGVLGVGLAAALTQAALTFAPPELPMIGSAHLDPRVLAFTAFVTVGSVMGFGLLPALRETELDAQHVLRTSGRSVTGLPLSGIIRRGLVAAQVALALVVLCSAGVLTRTLVQLQHTSLGFDPAHLLFFKLDAVVPFDSRRGYLGFPTRFTALRDRIAHDLPHVPGLGQVSTALSLPFAGLPASYSYTIDGQALNPNAPGRLMRYEAALDDYFGVMKIPLLRGRGFTPQDDRHGPIVVVVNESLARQAWPGQDPIGRRIKVFTDSVERWWTVVGVAADDRFTNLIGPRLPTTYFPARQEEWDDPWFVVHTAGQPEAAERLVGQTVTAMDPIFGVRLMTTGPQLLTARLARPRALAAVFGALAITALLLVALGLFGVLAAYVRDRRREMAVRSALGATPTQLRSLVLTQTLEVAVVGLACGIPLAIGGSHLLQTMVSDVHPLDVLTVVAVASVLLAVVACAAYGPMVRASRVDIRGALTAE